MAFQQNDEARRIERLKKIATPSRLAVSIGKQVTGFDFVLYAWLAYVEQRILDAVLDDRQRFIIINVPPRSGKTTLSGVFLPAWFQGMFPDKRTMFVTYSDDFSVKFGRAVRTILDRFGQELFGVGVDRSAQSASDWQMAGSFGGMLSTGIGGVLTGHGGDLIVVDDILKNIQEARSQTTKRMHIDWYDSTLRSRLHPGGTIIITATRWAEDDLSGTLIERMQQPGYEGDQWEIIDLPALAEPHPDEEVDDLENWTDLIGRKLGESINPERYSVDDYLKIKASIDPFLWSCLYQQRPTTPEGGMFPSSKWRYYEPDELPQMLRTVRVWDLATTDGAGDWTVGVRVGISKANDIYILDVQRAQLGTADVERAVRNKATGDGYMTKILIEQEKAGAGKAVVEHYQRLLAGFLVEAAKPSGSKEERATPYSALQQNGRVWLPAGAEWTKAWVKEHEGMMGDGRRPRHDDQIDTASYAVLDLLGISPVDVWVPGQDGSLLREQVPVERLHAQAVMSRR